MLLRREPETAAPPLASGPQPLPAPHPLRRDLRASIADGIAYSIMVGVGETYLPAYVLAMGMGEVAAGLVATVPLMAGAFLQLVTPLAVRRLQSHRRWVVLCASVQALTFLPLVVGALRGRISTAAVFLAAAVYWGAGLATAPAWNTWIGSLVPVRLRPRFFAARSRMAQGAVLLGLVGGGAALQCGSALGGPLAAFAVIFLVATSCRALSASFLGLQSEPAPLPARVRHVSLAEFVARFRRGRDGRLLLYLLLVQGSVQISAPYFTPFMLRELHFSYTTYMTLLATAFAARVVALPTCGLLAQRYGAGRLLWIGAIGVLPLSALWLVSSSIPYLLGVQVLAGTTWAAYELAMFLLFFETIPEEERTSVLTAYNFANAFAMAGGSLLGGAALAYLGKDQAAYHVLFAASFAGRLLSLPFLARARPAALKAAPIALRTLGVRPDEGSLDRPILPSLPREAQSEA